MVLQIQGEDLEQPGLWRDKPQMADTLASVDSPLLDPIDLLGRPRQDLADPVGGELQKRVIRKLWHTLTPPSREIGDVDVRPVSEVQFGLEQQDPAARVSVSSNLPVFVRGGSL
jgi:hypothetical protein